jgi:hypothetical protein
MSIQTFIAEKIFRPRAQSSRVLVIYDVAGQYHDIARGMTSEDCRVIMGDGAMVDVRKGVLDLIPFLAVSPRHHALVWLPFPPPALPLGVAHAQLQTDLAAVAVTMGPDTVFPAGADDSLQAICLKAFPDMHGEIHRLFEGGRQPGFSLINQLKKGQQWPELQAAIGAVAGVDLSSREIIEAFLERTNLDDMLTDGGPWVDEAKRLLQTTFGVGNLPAMRRASEFRNYLWRLVLFSEFIFDSSDDLPAELATQPRAAPAARELVFNLCESLRGKQTQQEAYMRNAEQVEAQLNLPTRVAKMRHLGRRDTFAFEERLFLDRFCESVKAGALVEAQEMVELRLKSMWVTRPDHEGRLQEWQAARSVLELLDRCGGFQEPPQRLGQLAEAYQANYHLLDRAHRLLEQAEGNRIEEHAGLEELITLARVRYLDCASRLHKAHLRAIELESWPPMGAELENACLFDRVVDPLLKQGKRVAYLLIDSLRYELAADLRETLIKTYKVELRLSYAQLPTYTEVGMASLMPQAKAKLRLKIKEQGGVRKLAAYLGERAVPDPTTRFNHLKEIMGDRCQHEPIARLQQGSRPHLDQRIQLYVVRGSDIDEASHAGGSRAMLQIPAMMREIGVAISKLARMGFDHVVIATDHGFMLRPVSGPGDACELPPGEWLVRKTRCVLGNGGNTSDPANFVIDRAKLGIEGDFNQFATPRAFLPYDGSTDYFHEGLSPQENFLPCLVINLATSAVARSGGTPDVFINTRGRTAVTTLCPSFSLEWRQEEFSLDGDKVFLIQVLDAAGAEVASLAMGDNVDHMTQRVTLQPGRPTKFGVVLKDGYAGEFTIKALDPETMAEYHSVKLTTNFAY